MAFNPGNENRSGEILAGGVNNIMGQYAQDLLRSQEIEQKRRTAAGQIQGLLASSPQLSQKADPTLLAKVQSGKGNYKDTLELLGTLNTVQKQEEDALAAKMKQVQMEQFMAHSQLLGSQNQELKARLADEVRTREAMQKAAPYIAGESQGDYGARGGYVMQNAAPPIAADPQRAIAEYLRAGGDARGADQLAQAMARVAPKPAAAVPVQPSSGGFRKVTIDGIGDIVVDNATGKTVGNSDIVKPAADKPEAKPTDTEVQFETNINLGLAKIAELRNVVAKYGNWESARMGNPAAAAALDQIPYQLAIAHAKIADPASVAREGEVAAAQKYMLPVGLLTTNAKTMAALDGLEDTFKSYATGRKKAQGETRPAAKAAEQVRPAAAGIRDFATAAEVQAAVDRGDVGAGAYVRVNGQLHQVLGR